MAFLRGRNGGNRDLPSPIRPHCSRCLSDWMRLKSVRGKQHGTRLPVLLTSTGQSVLMCQRRKGTKINHSHPSSTSWSFYWLLDQWHVMPSKGAALPWGHWRWRCFPFLFFSFLCMLISFFRSPTPTSMIFYSWNSNSGQILGSIHTLCIFYWYRATGEALKCLKLLLCLLARVWWMTCDRAFNEVFCQLAFNKDITHFVCVRCLDHRPTRMLLSTCMHTKACKLMQINAPRKILSFLFISFLRFFCYYRNIFTATVPKTFRMALIVQISHTVYSNCHLLFTHTACTLTTGM